MLTTAPNTFTAEGRARRALPVEEALRWAYVHELPKRERDRPIKGPQVSGMHPMWRSGIFGGPIDNWSREPGMPRAMGDPDPDAILIEKVVNDLDAEIQRIADRQAEGHDEAFPLDLAPYQIGYRLGPTCEANRLARRALLEARGWLVTFVVQNALPDIDESVLCEPAVGSTQRPTLWVTAERECGIDSQGQPIITRWDEQTTMVRGGEYRKGTFCKLRWVRGVNDIAEDRARWAANHAAKEWLFKKLQGLGSISVRRSGMCAAPWLDDSGAPTNVTSLERHRVKAAAPPASAAEVYAAAA